MEVGVEQLEVVGFGGISPSAATLGGGKGELLDPEGVAVEVATNLD